MVTVQGFANFLKKKILSKKYVSHINNRTGSFFKKWVTVYNYFFRNTTNLNDCAIPDTL